MEYAFISSGEEEEMSLKECYRNDE